MALPKVQEADVVEVVFHNHDKMHRQAGTLYASAKKNEDSELDMECEAAFILMGGEARIESVDQSAITLGAMAHVEGHELDECDIEYFRVERKFIKSLEVISRFTVVDFGDDGVEEKIPADASDNLQIHSNGEDEDEFSPASVRVFLKSVKKLYYDTKVKAKKKKQKKKPGPMKKGTKITKDNWREGMSVNVNAIPWLDAADDLDAENLHFVWNEGYFATSIQFGWASILRIYDPNQYCLRTIPDELIKSTTLAKAFTPSVAKPDPEDDPDHSEFGNMIITEDIGYQSVTFYDRGIEVGCKEFAVADVKKLYKALCKVYGEPK